MSKKQREKATGCSSTVITYREMNREMGQISVKLKDSLFKWKHYEPEIILLTVRWYLKYCLSYRDLAEMMSARVEYLAHYNYEMGL